MSHTIAIPVRGADAPVSPGSPAVLAQRARQTHRPIALIGFIRQGNLGIGYLAAQLKRYGHQVVLIDVEDRVHDVVDSVVKANPLIVGFSLIFQFYLPQFREIANALRERGLTSHMTMGGHFASLSSEEALRWMPELDSVVRFEGELTLLDLADRLSTGQDWNGMEGISWRDTAGQVHHNPLRHLLHDLDELPWPDRRPPSEHSHHILGMPVYQLLASRGCARTCSFCSIQTFYRAAPGKIVRTRAPQEVVREMHHLHTRQGARIFLFQDDDFPVVGKVWRRWALELVQALHEFELVGKVIWKISCRADAVEPELFATLRDAGLYLVYMGLESGNEEGLKVLNKEVDVAQNLAAVACLRALGIEVAFGFMMFDPASTFETVAANTDFLEQVVATGENAATFCRMVPYDGTPIKDQLKLEGRLKGDICNPDYDFLDPRLDDMFKELQALTWMSGWEQGQQALTPTLNTAWIELAVMKRLFPDAQGMKTYRQALRRATRESNALLIRMVRDVREAHLTGSAHGWSPDDLKQRCERIQARVVALRNTFIATNEPALIGQAQPA